MSTILKRMFKSYDYSLLIVYVLLASFGIVMVYSASTVWAIERGLEPNSLSNDQLRNFIVGFVAFWIVALVPYKLYREKTSLVIILVGMFALLIAVHFIGETRNFARSWIDLGFMSLQPSEFSKLGLIIYMAAVYRNKQSYINQLNKGVMPPVFVLAFACLLVALEPDFGTAGIIFVIGMCVMVASGMKFVSLLKFSGIGAIAAAVLGFFIFVIRPSTFSAILSEERLSRFTAYMDPFADIADNGWQLVGSYYAIGNGGIWGRGLGQSIQKIGYLPEAHTDFIMAIIAEELGILGVCFVLFGLGYLVFRAFAIGIKCTDPFGKMIAIGIGSMIGIQSFINLGGMSGVIPITGVPLPFVSYGGSSLLLLSISMGVLFNVSMFVKYEARYRNGAKEPVVKETVKPVVQSRNVRRM